MVFARYNLPRSEPGSREDEQRRVRFITSNGSAFFAADGEEIEFSMFMRVIESILPSKLPLTLLYYVVA